VKGSIAALALAASILACGTSTENATEPPASQSRPPDLAPLEYTGINFWSGVAHDEQVHGGVYGEEYGYDTQSIGYFTGKGMNVIRLAFRWEVVQKSLMAPLDPVELGRLDGFVKAANEQGASVILDVHDFARYQLSTLDPLPTPSPPPAIVGSRELPTSAFADLWSKLATHYAGNDRVVFGLMNEPHDMPTRQWVSAANAALVSIRAAGAHNVVLVPGNNWSHGYGWNDIGEGATDGVPNSVGLGEIDDPGHNYLIEVHQYLDEDGSGSHDECIRETVGSQALADVTGWLRQRGERGLLGEFGSGSGEVCLAALDDLLGYLEANRDVWVGWAYFSGGQGLEDQDMTIQPTDGADRPQMGVLVRHIAPTAAP
jgi:endoglucanase